MQLEKFAIPLTITASVIAIAVFLRNGTPAATVGVLPSPATIPSFARVPAITYNVATPPPAPVYPGSSYIPFVPPNGLITNNWFGAPFSSADVSDNSQNGCGCGCGSNSCDASHMGKITPYFNTVVQSSEL